MWAHTVYAAWVTCPCEKWLTEGTECESKCIGHVRKDFYGASVVIVRKRGRGQGCMHLQLCPVNHSWPNTQKNRWGQGGQKWHEEKVFLSFLFRLMENKSKRDKWALRDMQSIFAFAWMCTRVCAPVWIACCCQNLRQQHRINVPHPEQVTKRWPRFTSPLPLSLSLSLIYPALSLSLSFHMAGHPLPCPSGWEVVRQLGRLSKKHWRAGNMQLVWKPSLFTSLCHW